MSRFPDPQAEATAAHLANPQAGDRFTEHFSFWMYVLGVDTFGRVLVEEYRPPCTAPEDGTLRIFKSREDFSKAYAYKTHPGWSVSYVDAAGNYLLPAHGIPELPSR